MNGIQFKRIRNALRLTQEELAEVLCFSGKKAVSNIETGERNAGPLVVALMEVLAELPEARSKQLRELLIASGRRHSDRRKGRK